MNVIIQEKKQERTPRRWLAFLGETGFWGRALTVLLIVFAANLVIEFGVLTSVFPWLHKVQLRSHQLLFWMLPRPASSKWARMVVIDDELHQQLKEPTDRRYLAELVRNAAKGDAAVIVLDIALTVPKGLREGEDSPERKKMDDDLKNAIFDAAKLGVPVIVPCWMDRNGGKETVIPSIYPDSELPLAVEKDGQSECAYLACARRGNVNPADDERKIPLRTELGIRSQCEDSLALAADTAYEEATDRRPRTREKKMIADEIRHYDYVFGGFLPEDRFQTIPIRELAAGSAGAMRECRTRIVIIGGKWREALGQGRGVDIHETPAGPMAGVYLHANYIEALLDDRYMKEIPPVPALLFDLGVAALLYWRYHKATTTRGRYIVLSVFLLPLMFAYIFFVTLGFYLDFVLPLVGCFIHLSYELVADDVKLRREHQAGPVVAH